MLALCELFIFLSFKVILQNPSVLLRSKADHFRSVFQNVDLSADPTDGNSSSTSDYENVEVSIRHDSKLAFGA